MIAIYWREVRDIVKSLRFLIAVALFLSGMCVNGFVMGGAYQDLSRIHREIETQNDERIHEAASHLEQLAIGFNEIFGPSNGGHVLILNAPPSKMLPLAAGTDLNGLTAVEWNFPNLTEPADLSGGNPELPARPALDWEFMVRILLSFIAIMLSYDLLVGERERGTLALTLAYPISRRRVLLAKFFAVLTLLAWLLVAGGLLSAIIYLARGGAFSMTDYARMGLFILGAMLYVAIFVAVSLLVSSRARSSVSSLTILLIFWITATVVIPQGGTAAVQGSVRTVSDVQVEQRLMSQLEEQINDLVSEMDSFVRSDINEARQDAFAAEQRYAARLNRMMASAKATMDEQEASQRRQARVLENVIRLTPAGLFQLGSERLLGVGETRERHFSQTIERWSKADESFIKQQDLLDPDSPHVFYVQNYMSQKPVDERAIPRFRFDELSLAESLKSAALDWLLLVVELAVALSLSLIAFARARVDDRQFRVSSP